jgi:hypothetical protein
MVDIFLLICDAPDGMKHFLIANGVVRKMGRLSHSPFKKFLELPKRIREEENGERVKCEHKNLK